MRHIAKESRCFVISCCQAMHMDDIPDSWSFKRGYLGACEEWINPGYSLIADPDGKLVAGPLGHKEAILYAEIDPAHSIVGNSDRAWSRRLRDPVLTPQ